MGKYVWNKWDLYLSIQYIHRSSAQYVLFFFVSRGRGLLVLRYAPTKSDPAAPCVIRGFYPHGLGMFHVVRYQF